MPQRLLRPAIRQSKRWNRLSLIGQSLYIRLLTLVDDFGRYEADPQLLSSECFPYGDPDGNAVTCQQMIAACGQMSASDMVILYEFEGSKYMQLTRWKERVRSSESRFPAPLLTNDSKCQQMIASPPQPSPSPQPEPQPSSNGERMSGIDKMNFSKEFDRCCDEIKTIRATYGDHQTWTKDDLKRFDKLAARKKELKSILGVVV